MTESAAVTALQAKGARTLAIARYTLLEAWRNRFLLTMCSIVAVLIVLSLFIRQIAITESARTQIGFLSATLRMAAVFVMSLYVLQGLLREFQDKVLELVLSLDLPRWCYLLGKFCGYLVLCLACSAIAAAPLLALADPSAVLAWAFTLSLELSLVAAAALFCMTTFTQLLPAASFVLAFYLLARSITAIQLMSASTLLSPSPVTEFSVSLADLLALVLPRLDAFTQTAWLIDASALPLSWAFAAVQTAIYVALLLAAAMFDLHRKNF
ncbi:MAG: ABC transporter permease [Burkholderiales bacterium]